VCAANKTKGSLRVYYADVSLIVLFDNSMHDNSIHVKMRSNVILLKA
jgi:hypothetical protein